MLTRRPRTFVDASLEAQFHERGFFTLPLVDQSTVDHLRSLYEQHRPSTVDGYHATLGDPDTDTRQAVSAAVVDVLREPVLALLTNHRMLMGTFTVKEPTADSIKIPHTDPVLTDEPRYRSVAIWLALVDTDDDNGMLWVLEGSHREASTFRLFGPDPEKDWAAETLASAALDRRKALPLEAGHAVLYDHALVHWSGPNASASTRVAAAAVALPRKQPLVCCWINGMGERERWAVPDEFHVTMMGTRPRDVGQPLKVR